jgi:hypothetical protein
MNKLKHFIMPVLLFASLGFITSCNPDDDGDTDIRDAVVSWSLTGACTQTENVTYVDNDPTSSANISVAMYNSANQALSVVFTETSLAWNWGWTSTSMSQLQVGTYTIELGGGYGTPCAVGFTAVSGELHITSVDEAPGVGNPGDRYITGTITIVFENSDIPPATFTLEGSFTDLYIATS